MHAFSLHDIIATRSGNFFWSELVKATHPYLSTKGDTIFVSRQRKSKVVVIYDFELYKDDILYPHKRVWLS